MTWINNYIYNEVWAKIIHPFSNFNVAADEIWEWMNYFIRHFTGLGFTLIHVNKWGSLVEACQSNFLRSAFSHFSELPNHCLSDECPVNIWLASLHVRCGDTCQIWTWLRHFISYCCKIKIVPSGDSNDWGFSNPTPGEDGLRQTI